MILVECDPDEVLVKTLIPNLTKNDYSHAGNNTGVIKRLIKEIEGTGHIGIIDKDPGSIPPGYFSKFDLVQEWESLNIELLTAPNNAKLIVLYPNLEGWSITATRFIHLKLKDYSLPESEKELHKTINEKPNLMKFAELIKDLEQKSKHVQQLKAILIKYHK